MTLPKQAAQRGIEKILKISIDPASQKTLPKPSWLKVKALGCDASSQQVAQVLEQWGLRTVCREAFCPNKSECFSRGTATFLIMGDKCTRRCPFCDVAHGHPDPLDATEPSRLAQAAKALELRYAVITSVDRDDLDDGGASHFAQCIQALREALGRIQIEILVPDFRGRQSQAVACLSRFPPDVFNHNIETVPSLYRSARPGADYRQSLQLLRQFKDANPTVLTKSGLMLGLGETDEQVDEVLRDLRAHAVDIVTIGQYLAPSPAHRAVQRYVAPSEFDRWASRAMELGFYDSFCGVFVRSSYHADRLAKPH